ncbi:MAG: autotransporter outer membrane beta-barrel domain-containing protein [Alphaproteobacteria bacterium]|jgi:hypothetical protein|nr:autotransporter outer membrane beta-barrel domain-containing protein [Alphaproteobacteria bacterium]
MLRFSFVFMLFFLFAINFNPSSLQAKSCVYNDGITGNTSNQITVSGCDISSYTDVLGNEVPGGTVAPDNNPFTISLNTVSGYIREVGGNSIKPSNNHTLSINNSNISIGKLFNDTASTGFLILNSNSTATFIDEGLQTDSVKITTSKLVLDGAKQVAAGAIQDNKINTGLEIVDNKSSLVVDNRATLDVSLESGKEIKGNIEINNAASMTLNYNDVDPADKKTFKIANLRLSGENSTLTKNGDGEVIIAKSAFDAPNGKDFKIIVNDGILNAGAIGDQSDKSADAFTINGGKFKYSNGNFKATVGANGAIEFLSKDNTSALQINPQLNPSSPAPAAEGKLIADGKFLNLINTNLDTLEVKSGTVNIATKDNFSQNYNTNITHLIMTGGTVDTGRLPLGQNGAYFENIEINGGIFNYATNDFSGLQSLKISNKGEFRFLGGTDLTLDGVDAGDEGIITLQANSNTLTLKNSDVATINLNSSSGESSLNIDSSNHVGKLNITFLYDVNTMDIQGSNIDEIEMKQRGTLNIEGTATIKSLINSSVFTPKINIKGGNIDLVALNRSGDINISGSADIKNLSLIGFEKVNIDGGNIDNFTVNSKGKKAELVMNGGNIGTFRLEQIIAKLELKGTTIDTYEIALEDQTFDFTQQKVNNLVLDGKKSVVNLGDGKNIPTLQTIILDQGTLNYNYDKDNTIKSITTTIDHPKYPQEECKDDDKKCKEENDKKPLIDTEFKVEAGNATLTTDKIKLENLNLQSGYIKVNDNFETEKKLTIAVSGDQKTDLNNRPKIFVAGDVKMAGELNVEFKETYEFLLGVENKFSLIQYSGALDKSTEFKFLTNLSYWFDVKEEEAKNSLLVAINRKYSYKEVVEQNGGGRKGGIYDMAGLLDDMITKRRGMPDHMKLVITGLDTKSPDGNALIVNISKLLPVSNRVYANSIHTNNQKNIDMLSTELRDFTNLEDNLWAKIKYSATRLNDNKDVIGYNESSQAMQLGYSKIITTQAIAGAALSYWTGNLDGNHSNFSDDFTTLNAAVGVDYLFTPKIYGKTIFNYSHTQFNNTRNLNFIKVSNNSKVNSSSYLTHVESGYITELDDKFYNFNATYNAFYSIGSIGIGSYKEEGFGKLNVGGANILVNDIGIGSTFDKEILYPEKDVSLKPSVSFAAGIRYYSGATTDFKFQEIEDTHKFRVSNGSYLPIFMKYKMGVDYIAPWANISVSYRLETDAYRYYDNSFYLSFKHSF